MNIQSLYAAVKRQKQISCLIQSSNGVNLLG